MGSDAKLICARILRNDDIVAEVVGGREGLQDADIRICAESDQSINAQLPKRDVKVGLEETVIAALFDQIIAVLNVKAGQRQRSRIAGQTMLAPKLKLMVNTCQMGIIHKDNGQTRFTARLYDVKSVEEGLLGGLVPIPIPTVIIDDKNRSCFRIKTITLLPFGQLIERHYTIGLCGALRRGSAGEIDRGRVAAGFFVCRRLRLCGWLSAAGGQCSDQNNAQNQTDPLFHAHSS